MEWYYADDSDQQISFEESQFASLIQQNKIKPDTLVWNSTMDDWKKASLVQPTLFTPMAGVASPQAQTQAQQPAAYSQQQDPILPTNPHAPQMGQYQPPPTDGLSIASMICGIFSILLSCAYGFGLFPALAAIICGHMALKKNREMDVPMGSGMATAGLVTGYIGLAIAIGFIILIIIGVTAAILDPTI